jgi:hypothetical protein
MDSTKLYDVTVYDNYIKVSLWGDAGGDEFEASNTEVLAVHERTHIGKLLCDIQNINPVKIDIRAQAKGIGSMLKLRHFDKVAFVFGKADIANLLHSSMDIAHLDDRFQAFSSIEEAIAWLDVEGGA